MHPASRCEPVRSIEAVIARAAGGGLRVSWTVTGAISRLRLPPAAPPVRADGLWQHSCFEVFLRAGDKDAYAEWNLAPSGAWACYRFERRRAGRSRPAMRAPSIETAGDIGAFTLAATLAAGELPELCGTGILHAGLAAVIEDQDGALSYWALAHGGDAPDFHDPATFTVALPGR